jgi:hypothetical protein
MDRVQNKSLLYVFSAILQLLLGSTSSEEHRLRVFENRVLRRIFGPKRDEAIGGWRKLHNEELHNLYCSPSTIRIIKTRRMGWAGHVERMRERRRRRKRHIGFSEGKRPLGRCRRRWEDNIKMDGVVSTGLIWLRIATSEGPL